MKRFTATKHRDQWLVEITDIRYIPCESDVYKLIRQEGMKVKDKRKQFEELGDDEITEIRGE